MSCPGVEFLILNYNSTDNLEQWAYDHLNNYIKNGKLNYYKTDEPQYYLRSHSRNLAFKLARGNIVCNIDADNYLGSDFALFVRQQFKNKNIYLAATKQRDTLGKICCRKSDFIAIRGYNEGLKYYGYEDLDLRKRLALYGRKLIQITDPEFTRVINHDNSERVNNEYIARNLKSVYIRYVNPFTSSIIFLLKDQTFLKAKIIDSYNIPKEFNPDYLQNLQSKSRYILEVNSNISGFWRNENGKEILISNGLNKSSVYDRLLIGAKEYKRIEDATIQCAIIELYSEVINEYEIATNTDKINKDGFGKGVVKKNFSSEIIHLK